MQPRGVLVVVREPDFQIRQISANVDDVLGRSVADVLGRHLYAAVQTIEEPNRAASLTALYDTAVRAVRELTGSDRVMVYRYDEECNGEVVAACKRDSLNSFLGLHYRSTAIPAQARGRYENNRLRLTSDADYTPAPLTPTTTSPSLRCSVIERRRRVVRCHGAVTIRSADCEGSNLTCGRPVRGCGPTLPATPHTSAISAAVRMSAGGPAHTGAPSRSTTIWSQ